MRYILLALFLAACATGPSGRSGGPVSIDQVPMYGGMDRSRFPELKAADEKLIQDTARFYGSREAASRSFADTAFRYYRQDKLEAAMRRFNQARLINPENPDVYWGFASVLHDQGKDCEALKLLEVGLSKGPLEKGYLPDHAFLYAACARNGEAVSSAERDTYLRRSSEIFVQAEADLEVMKPYLYYQWTRALIELGEYSAAWGKVKNYREHTSQPFDADVLRSLSAKMSEPK